MASDSRKRDWNRNQGIGEVMAWLPVRLYLGELVFPSHIFLVQKCGFPLNPLMNKFPLLLGYLAL